MSAPQTTGLAPQRFDDAALFPMLGVPFAFAIVGLLVGAIITAIAWALDTSVHGVPLNVGGIWYVHGENPLHVLLDMSPVVFGGIGYLAGVARSRTAAFAARIHALESTRFENTQWRKVVTSSPDGILVVGPSGQVRQVNPAAERVFGRRGRDLRAMRISELLENAQRMTNTAAITLRTGLGEELGTGWKILAKHGTGALVPVVVTVTVLGTSQDAPTCYRVRDVSFTPKRMGDQNTPTS